MKKIDSNGMKNSEKIRPSWDEYFLNIVATVSTRASCDRGKSACVIVKNNRILSTGYVGSPSGMPDCYEHGHLLRTVTYENGETREHCVRTIHAEQNAIIYAARYGVSIEGSTIYCTMLPCRTCAMQIISAGIVKVVCANSYQVAESLDLFKSANIPVFMLNSTTISY